ncbi:MAG: class I SAM-dependent methyltransferase, partial [Bacteroidota bacterium]
IYAQKGQELDDGEWRDLRHLYRETLMETLNVDRNAVFFKLRKKAKGGRQYDKLAWVEHEFEVKENGLKFLVNLTDYLDTGLFLDHRQTRKMVQEKAQGKRVLNLFAYTGSFTVYAAAGGAKFTHTFDLSNTYLEWSKRNLELNGFDGEQHQFERADVKQWLSAPVKEKYDLVVLDPPTFSNSKAMVDVLDTQRDHVELINNCLLRLSPSGQLYFSTNYRRFKLEKERINAATRIKEITKQTVPPDFRKRNPHRCWVIEK